MLSHNFQTFCYNTRHVYFLCSGGLSNLLYTCAIENDSFPTMEHEPRKVLLRIYGQIIREHPETVVKDSVIFALLSERGMGPRLYGVFTGGRVEEYIKVQHSPSCGFFL